MSFYMNLSVSQDDTADGIRQATTPGIESKNKVSDAEKHDKHRLTKAKSLMKQTKLNRNKLIRRKRRTSRRSSETEDRT